MHVIYVHGVSERPSHPDFNVAIVRRQKLFDQHVARRVPMGITTFDAAGWGDECPKLVLRTKKGQALSGNQAHETTRDPVTWQEFVDPPEAGGLLNAAPFLEAALLRDPALDGSARDAISIFVADLSEAETKITPPTPGETHESVIQRIEAARYGSTPAGQTLDLGQGLITRTLAKSVEYAVSPFVGRLRDVVARELALRWTDIVWYFGDGRNRVRNVVLDRFDSITAADPKAPVVVLAHSLGGFIAFDAINSAAFEERGLKERGPWILFCLGSQLSIYHQLGLMRDFGIERGQRLRMRSALSGRVRFRNIVDPNDPLGFQVDETDDALAADAEELDSRILSGANFLSAHGTYLDSTIVLGRIRRDLRRLLRDLKVLNA